MAWTERKWTAFVAVMELGFPGAFTEDEREVYRLMLDDIEPEDAMIALRSFADTGSTFRPSVGNLRGHAKPLRAARRQQAYVERWERRQLELEKRLALPVPDQKNAVSPDFQPQIGGAGS